MRENVVADSSERTQSFARPSSSSTHRRPTIKTKRAFSSAPRPSVHSAAKHLSLQTKRRSQIAPQLQQRQCLPDPFAPPPDVIPDITDHTWQRVRARKAMSKQSGFARQTTASRGRQILKKSGIIPSDSETSITSASHKSRSARVVDKEFRTNVLERYAIRFSTKISLETPFEHFGTEPPPTDPTQADFSSRIASWYKFEQGHKDCSIWLSICQNEAGRIAGQYARMAAKHENEAKFSFKSKEYFFKEDDLPDPADADANRLNTAYFLLEWGPSPDGNLLQCPPQVCGPKMAHPFSFNTRPDCTYWLTLSRMNPRYRANVQHLTFALPDAKAVAPYLTIEFKKNDKSIVTAENQIAASAALILYNRVRLRCERLKAYNVPSAEWSSKYFSDIKHYGIAFIGCNVQFYKVTPEMEDTTVVHAELESGAKLWKGCKLEMFCCLTIDSSFDVLAIQEWINEIHNWGLGKYSEAFVLDIKSILGRTAGGTDRVSMTPAELKEWGLD